MADSVMLSKEAVTLLVDKCTDGALTAEEADKLAAALRQDDDGAQWILNELELAGLISEAFSKTTVEDFIRGFCERLSAEAASDAFTVDTQRVIASRRASSHGAGTKRRLRDMFSMPGGTGEERSRSAGVRRRSASRRLALVGLGVLALGVAFWGMLGHARTATLVSASGNVVLHRDGGQLPPRPGTRLVVGDALRVPASGSAALSFDKKTVVHVAEHSEAAIAEASSRSSDGTTIRQLELRRGNIIVDVGSARRGRGLMVRTPHASIEAGASRFAVGVTLSSTRLTVEVGTVTLAREGGAARVELAGGESIIVGKGDPLRVDESDIEGNGGEDHDR